MEVAPQYLNIPPFLTETELEVAVILSELPELLRDPGDRPHVPPHLRWGARRRRRSPRLRSSSSPSAAIPEDDPSPSTSLPHRPRLDDETKGDTAAAAAAAAAIAGSPSSPLSFPASGSEEPESHPPRPPPPPPPPPPLPAPSITSGMKYSSKNSKHHNEMLKEYSHVVASLSAESSILRQEIEQYKINCTIIKAENSQLIEHRSKLLENQTVLPQLAEAEAAVAAPSAIGAPPADWAAEHRQRSATAKRKVEFDLNKLSAEAAAAAAAAEREAAAAAAAQSAHKAAKSAKARRRRMEIQRAKRIAAAAAAAATAVSAPGSMPSTVHKMPRLR